jgi:hypothetical protein
VRARAAAEEARKAAEAEQRRKKQEAAKAAAAEQVRKDLKDYLRKRAPARAAVIKRYGSIEAAIAPCDREKLLREAVRKWSKFRDDPRWTASISDHADAFSITLDKPSKTAKRIIDAIATAYPLPDTIEGAIAEEAYWHRRDHEFRLVLEEDYSDDVLDMPAAIRQKILSDLIDTLPARNVRDVLLRVQAGHRDMINRADPDTVEEMSEDTQRAVIRDLKALCAEADRTVVVSHEEFRAARQKRQKPVTKAKQPAQERQSDFGF